MEKRDPEPSALACAALAAMVGSSAERAELLCHGTDLIDALLSLLETRALGEKGDRVLLIEGLACLISLRAAVESGASRPDSSSLRVRCKMLLRRALDSVDEMVSSGHPAACGQGGGKDRGRLARTRGLYAQGLKMLHALSLGPGDRASCVLA
jgi:hypothetical protein